MQALQQDCRKQIWNLQARASIEVQVSEVLEEAATLKAWTVEQVRSGPDHAKACSLTGKLFNTFVQIAMPCCECSCCK